MTTIFVYGTLKRGYGNWERLLKDRAEFLGEAVSIDKTYAMWLTGFPLLADTRNGSGSYVVGELFEVSDEVLSDLDRLEGHPGWYCREPRRFFNQATGRLALAQVYLIDLDRVWVGGAQKVHPRNYHVEWKDERGLKTC
jgi:gamma-glutamylcyclotransferase (GGCT)/AIG2-like uncharacterized protein YtfP